MTKKRIAVIISGYGGNLQGIMNAAQAPDYPAEIVLVISNKADAYGLVRAKNAGIPNFTINHKEYKNRAEFDMAMHAKLLEYKVELICLAGFMRLLTPEFVEKWQGRMLNIHPSLLPEFKGANAVEDALAANATKTGCTVHYVTAEMDAGPIIIQRVVDILPIDTIDTLNVKIHAEEHVAYPAAIKIVCETLA